MDKFLLHHTSLSSHSLWSFFGWSTIRNFLEFPALSIGPFQKVQREMIYFPYELKKWKAAVNCPNIVAYTIKIMKSGSCNSWAAANHNIHDVWNWNCWTLFGSEIEMGGHGPLVPSGPHSGYAPVDTWRVKILTS